MGGETASHGNALSLLKPSHRGAHTPLCMSTAPARSLSVRMGSGLGGFAGLAEAAASATDEVSETTAKDEEKG